MTWDFQGQWNAWKQMLGIKTRITTTDRDRALAAFRTIEKALVPIAGNNYELGKPFAPADLQRVRVALNAAQDGQNIFK